MDIKTKLKRFIASETNDVEVKLTKLASNRSSRVSSGHSVAGTAGYRIFDDKTFGVEVYGRGFNSLGTSPIVEIVDETEKEITFKTEGGLYKMELY